ncbi:hypothetical protein BDY19DRAFT_1041644 [Irpex rosettiformis]|uniref:Uncharacterized protein n=1 Tax=Irpex rosettiformis TaxID=378272 RepID=A0ACB8U536_9APHY|nr:hypothetical protein BDY19DRAFT_1041644 [Irpex rosettiformis]
MKYVALLSGGKDSCYNLLHCYNNGHELVAAASLGPQPGTDELDSYMYQTVGQDAIEYVAQALEVPLFRKVISGTAVDMSSEYGSRHASANTALEGDETEDLYALLAIVKENHPDIQGVSVGAILSNYQRVRVEHVCRRLGLTPLTFLWQRDQRELLSEMVEAGLEAILIKVAGVGLQTKHLGKTLAQMQPTLLKLNDMYGSHVCGEGGEYESLTLDCPLFKRRIHLEETETVIHSDNDFATVAYLRIKRATLQEKEASEPDPPVPPLLDEEYEQVQSIVQTRLSLEHTTTSPPPQYSPTDALVFRSSSSRRESWVAVTSTRTHDFQKNISLEEEVHECFQSLKTRLGEHSLDTCHIANINILISSMDHFTRINAVYQTYFGSSPASRACVAIDMPDQTCRIKLEAIAYIEQSPADRQALHVQGLSYWAPANIGPYSQAVIVHDQRVFISGQIGLLPHTLTLPTPQSLALETALACQHVDRVIRALKSNSGGGWEGYIQLAVYWLQDHDAIGPVHEAVKNLYSMQHAGAPTLFIGVPALPKGALVEKQVIVHTGRFLMADDEGNITSTCPESPESAIFWARSTFINNASPITIICIRGAVDDRAETSLSEALPSLWDSALLVRVFYRPSDILDYPDFMLRHTDLPTSSIPCKFVSAAGRDDWDLAICILGV